MRSILIIIFIVCVLALPTTLGYEDRFFSVKDNPGEYEVLPGDTIDFTFNISNRDMLSPRNVTAFIKDCPVGWTCEQKVFAYNSDGIYSESLKVKVSGTAIPRKYVMYIMLESEWDARRGDDKVIVTVISEDQAKTLTYEEYVAKEAERKAAEEERVRAIDTYVPPDHISNSEPDISGEDSDIEDVAEPAEPEPIEDSSFIKEEATEIVGNVERLETSHQFVEYASVVFGAILVLLAIGAFVTYRKDN